MQTVQTIEQGRIKYLETSGDRIDKLLSWVTAGLQQMAWWFERIRFSRLTHQWITEGPFEVQESEKIFCNSHYSPMPGPLPEGYEYYISSDGLEIRYSCAWCHSQ